MRDTIHQSFANLYAVAELLYQTGAIAQADYEWLIENYCSAALSSAALSSAESNRLTAKYTVAFLKTVLARESGYQSILTPGYALTREECIEFFVTEKKSAESIEENWPSWPDLDIYFTHQPGSWAAKAAKNQ